VGLAGQAFSDMLAGQNEQLANICRSQLKVTYRGEDPRLAGRNNLTLVVVKPILKEWGY
jgi:hypothetical protein